jgi:hypothetical protein
MSVNAGGGEAEGSTRTSMGGEESIGSSARYLALDEVRFRFGSPAMHAVRPCAVTLAVRAGGVLRRWDRQCPVSAALRKTTSSASGPTSAVRCTEIATSIFSLFPFQSLQKKVSPIFSFPSTCSRG